METLLIIILVPPFIGWIAGQIFIISKFIEYIGLQNPFFNFCAKFLLVIFSVIALNFPGLIVSLTRSIHPLRGYEEYTTFDGIVGIFGIIWYFSISFIGIYNILKDWLLKYKSIKQKKLQRYNKSLESDA